MKKLSKALALISSAIIATCTMSGISASAVEWIDSTGDFVVDGGDEWGTFVFRYFNDTEIYKKYPDKFPGVLVYQSMWQPDLLFSCNKFAFHRVELTVKNDGWKEIYDKYAEQIGFNNMYTTDDTIELECYLDCTKYDSKEEARAAYDAHMETLKEKYDLVVQMCTEMYKKGCIDKADYIEYFVCDQERMRFSGVTIRDFEGTPEEAQEIVESVDENLYAEPVVNIIGMPYEEEEALVIDENGKYVPLDYKKLDYYKELYKDKYEVELVYVMKFKPGTPREMMDIESEIYAYEAIKDKYPNITVNNFEAYFPATDLGTGVHILTDTINLISPNADDDIFGADIGDTTDDGIVYGDINADSKIGIGDAIAINKYINESIVFNKSQIKAADLNEDGAVNVDDLNIMLQYLVDIIDEFPVSK